MTDRFRSDDQVATSGPTHPGADARVTPSALARVLAETVVLPLVSFAVLSTAGAGPLWSLVGSAATSVLVVADRYRRTGVLSTLGLIILCRFGAGLIVALATASPRLTLAKDPAFTAVVALGALATLVLDRPLTARIRRELSPDAAAFDHAWSGDERYRRLHRQLTTGWAVGLALESGVGFVVVGSVSFTSAVVITRLLGPVTLMGLSAWTTYADTAATRRPVNRRSADGDASPQATTPSSQA